jgi:hypothetical protein
MIFPSKSIQYGPGLAISGKPVFRAIGPIIERPCGLSHDHEDFRSTTRFVATTGFIPQLQSSLRDH